MRGTPFHRTPGNGVDGYSCCRYPGFQLRTRCTCQLPGDRTAVEGRPAEIQGHPERGRRIRGDDAGVKSVQVNRVARNRCSTGSAWQSFKRGIQQRRNKRHYLCEQDEFNFTRGSMPTAIMMISCPGSCLSAPLASVILSTAAAEPVSRLL